jgi:TRAP transporter 4TM/12TM fusion protein
MTVIRARPLVDVMAVVLTCAVIAWVLDLYRLFGLVLYTAQFIAGTLAIATPLVFLHLPARRDGERQGPVPWYDLVAAGLSLLCASYMVVRYPILSELASELPSDGLVVGVIMIVLLLEGLRRTTGLALLVVVVAFLLLALVGYLLPQPITGRQVGWDALAYYLTWDVTAVLGTPLQIITTVVICFTIFGNVLFRSGGANFFTDISMALMGRYRGGPAKIAILGSSLFGMISGNVVSNVATVGVVTIPLMKAGGYRPHLAAAIEATASTGGQLMPPVMGVAAFLMAEFLEVPYRDVAVAAIIPSLLFYMALFIQTDFEAARSGLAGIPADRIPNLVKVLRDGWFFPVPVAVLVVGLFWLNWTPEYAALSAAAITLGATIVFKFQGRRVTIWDIVDMLRVIGLSVLDLFMIGAAAGMVIGVLNITGLGFAITLSAVNLAGGNLYMLLLIAAVISILLGMGMPTVAVYVLLATLIAPALIQMKIMPIAAHMFIMYFGMLSMITPPVAIGAFAAANIAGASPMLTGYAAMRFGWTAFIIPFLFVFSGTLLGYGNPVLVLIDFIAAVWGVWLISGAMMGYALQPLSIAGRLLFGVAGLALLIPIEAVGGGRWINLFGAMLAVALIGVELYRRRRLNMAVTAP